MDQIHDKGADSFMSKWYVGYGHKSIGDCGTITIFVENVSMFVAKAIQDNPLYNGQEASTRYLDMADQPVVNPANTPEGETIQRTWIQLYKDVLATLIPHFEKRFPHKEGQKKSVWKKAVKARAFDVARGFLPAGCCTYVAWHTNLRQAADHLKLLRHSPCKEIREVGGRIEEELLKRYPSSFGHNRYSDQEEYLAKSIARFAFSEGELCSTDPEEGFCYDARRLNVAMMLDKHQDLLESRPPKTELHQRFRQYGQISFEFPLDFGSYRDIQRHRSCVQEMPLLSTKYGLHPWYIEQLPHGWGDLVQKVAASQAKLIDDLDLPPEEKQYYVAMGYTCPIKITCPLPSAVYIAELRSGSTVHPTLRVVAQKIGDTLQELIPDLAMHHDKSAGVCDIKRGEQDIVKI
jgi:thymidylate synthase ThyX